MKNTGLTITIILAILAFMGGSYFMMWKKDDTKRSIDIVEDSQIEAPNEDLDDESNLVPITPETEKNQDTNIDIDSELKSLDSEMSSAFEKDSDSDPTLEIE